ncbi:MAG: hypothetical protein HQ567_05155 [Candidatus Nealsonbacteria bacterium]|nr:hypothetical protein [Candidatus Nealsonbacteria bacterium]
MLRTRWTMPRLYPIAKKIKLAALAVVCWLAVYAPALAQAKPEEEEEGGSGNWMMSYGLVLLGIVLGMLVVCRSSHRRDRAQQEMFADSDEELDDE